MAIDNKEMNKLAQTPVDEELGGNIVLKVGADVGVGVQSAKVPDVRDGVAEEVRTEGGVHSF